MYKAVFLLVFLTVTAIARSQDYLFKPEHSVILDAGKGKEMMDQCSRKTPKHVNGFWNVTPPDLQKLEQNFKKILSLKPSEPYRIAFRIDNLGNFAYQYIGVMIKGKHYIYINALGANLKDRVSNDYKTWETDPVIMCDGGPDFWGALFDIRKMEFSDLEMNGE